MIISCLCVIFFDVGSLQLLNNVNDIIEHIEIDAIVIPVIGVYKERCINIVLSCTWDDENGIGVRVLNEAVDEVGYQDIAF